MIRLVQGHYHCEVVMDEKQNRFITCTCRPQSPLTKTTRAITTSPVSVPTYRILHFKYKHLSDPIRPSTLVLPNELQLEICVRFVIHYFPFILIYVTLRATNLYV